MIRVSWRKIASQVTITQNLPDEIVRKLVIAMHPLPANRLSIYKTNNPQLANAPIRDYRMSVTTPGWLLKSSYSPPSMPGNGGFICPRVSHTIASP